MNNNLFYIGLKGVFCFKPPYPQLCEVLKVTSQLAILTQISQPYSQVASLSENKDLEGLAEVSTTSSITTQTSVYNFTNDTIASGAILDTSLTFKAGAGNSTTAIFAGGGSSGSTTQGNPVSSLYTYASNSFAQGAQLTFPFVGAGATSNQINAIIGGGLAFVNTSGAVESPDPLILGIISPYRLEAIYNTCLYTYSSNTAVASTNLSTGGFTINAVGNSTIAIFGLGSTINKYSENTEGCIYTYATAAVSSYFYLSNNQGEGYQHSSAAGNTEQAIFVRNGKSSTVSIASIIYTYSTGATSEGQVLSQANSVLPGTGTSTLAIFGASSTDIGTSNITTLYQYTYSTGQFTESQQLTFEGNSDAAACNSNIGVNA